MLTNHRSVSLCYLSTDLELLVHLDAIATLYQRNNGMYHVVLNNVDFANVMQPSSSEKLGLSSNNNQQKNLLWLEISPYRVIMTQQNKNGVNYRHFWERGIYGKSRYWLNENHEDINSKNSILLRNFTRNLQFSHLHNCPQSLRIEYELWSNNLTLGHYVLHLEIN